MSQAKYASIDAVVPEAVQALLQQDKKLKVWVNKIGALALPKRQSFELVDALARSILYQQLHGKAADTIVKRLEALACESVFSAGALARLSTAEYRSVGVSGNKAKALHSLADVAFSGGLPGPRQLMKFDNDTLIKMLTPIHGIGAWTVQMLLIFRLGRPDVWPIDDFGVRKGVQIAHKMAVMPTPKEMTAMAEKFWTPHLSLAALYFWRIADLTKLPAVKSTVKVSPQGDTKKRVSPQGDTEKRVSPQGDTKKRVSPQGDTEKRVKKTAVIGATKKMPTKKRLAT